MKRLVTILSLLLLVGCAEKQEYEQAIMEQMKSEKDIRDYKIDPEEMTRCVVDVSSKNMPGFLPIDPIRLDAYKNYAQMLTLNKASDPKKAMEVLREKFGSAKGLADAHGNYTESVVACIESLVNKTEPPVEKKSENEKK